MWLEVKVVYFSWFNSTPIAKVLSVHINQKSSSFIIDFFVSNYGHLTELAFMTQFHLFIKQELTQSTRGDLTIVPFFYVSKHKPQNDGAQSWTD